MPPDAIPALEDPTFEPAADVEWLEAVEPVLALDINGDARAYPLRIMTWHELVNGTVGGVPVTVSYCPLCNSAVAYDRRVGERTLDFGTSGALLNSSLVMYDRQTESLWSHYTGQAVVGHLTGAELDLIPVQTVSFEAFLASHADGQVLSLDTGHFRQYGQNPYQFYDSSNRPFLFGGPFDDRLEPITRVLALRDGDEGAVIPYDVLSERRVVAFTFAGRDLVALFEPGTASALDRPVIAEGRDVGATGVFVASIGGRSLALSASADGGFVDAGTGALSTTSWAGPPAAPGRLWSRSSISTRSGSRRPRSIPTQTSSAARQLTPSPPCAGRPASAAEGTEPSQEGGRGGVQPARRGGDHVEVLAGWLHHARDHREFVPGREDPRRSSRGRGRRPAPSRPGRSCAGRSWTGACAARAPAPCRSTSQEIPPAVPTDDLQEGGSPPGPAELVISAAMSGRATATRLLGSHNELRLVPYRTEVDVHRRTRRERLLGPVAGRQVELDLGVLIQE